MAGQGKRAPRVRGPRRRAAGAAVEPAVEGETPPTDPALFFNREISWLDFNRRVLEEAKEPDNPLLERLKFIAIFDSNLDEFFMKRIGGLKEQVSSNLLQTTADGRNPRQQLEAIDAAVRPLVAEQHRVFQELLPALAARGLEIVTWSELGAAERTWARSFFDEQVLPVLTPLALDPAHPFPFISNLSLSLAVAVRDPGADSTRFARVKVPGSIARWVRLPGANDSLRFLPLEELIARHLDHLFSGMEVLESHGFRVTRNADLQFDDDPADDLLEAIQEELRERRFARVVRLQVADTMPGWMRDLLVAELQVHGEDVFAVPAPLALCGLMPLAHLPLFELRDAPWRPVTHPRLASADGEAPDIFQVVSHGDLLLHHPYDSFATSVQRFVEQAARDPQVLAIKLTLYRTQRDSPIVNALIEAAEAGKQVAVTVELKARFDEERNIQWAEKLEQAGAHVTYGLVGLKTHTKLALVVRQESDGLKSYAHIATGNYNAETASLYTDLGLLTCRPEIAADVARVFNLLTGYVHRPAFEKLLVAPANLRARLEELIEREIAHQEAGRGGRICAKMNALEDAGMVRALYRAARAGVEIDLVVRGICRLRPGVPGLSETVRVRSIVGRFLEHSRIFWFGNGSGGGGGGGGEPEVFLGSADWMSRNLDFRVEAVTPVEDPVAREELRQILDICLADNTKAWELSADGSWRKLRPGSGQASRSSQTELMEAAMRRAAPPRAAG